MAQTTQKTRVTCQTASSLIRYQHWAWRGRHRKHSLIYSCALDHVYKAVNWQRVDQIRYSIIIIIIIVYIHCHKLATSSACRSLLHVTVLIIQATA
jgi:hypothetical protein